MPELKLKTRYKAAGDVFNALLAVGFDPETASAFLNGIHDADVAEVVRCKDCKHGQKNNYGQLRGHYICEYDQDGVLKPINHFCGYGERR